MDAGQTWPEPLGAPPPQPPAPPEFPPDPQTSGEGFHQSVPPPPQWHDAGDLHQQLSFPNPTNPSSNYYQYQYNSIGSPPKVQEIAPHGNVYADQPPAAAFYPLEGAAASADPSYSYTVNGSSSVAMAAVDWIYSYGREDPRAIAAKEAIRLYGAHPMSSLSRPWKVPKSKKISKKSSKKKTPTKVVQAAYCEVCKVDCNSQDVLKSHSEGKKHKKKLKQQEDTIKREAAAAAVAEKSEAGEPAVTEDRTADESEKLDVDLETKRSKILESGGYVDEVRVCTICNIAVNSQKVFEYHLEGQKHAAMAEKVLGDLSSHQVVEFDK